jgi:3-oxoadipate enol-lactonase
MPFAQLPDVRLHYRIDGDAGSPPLLLSNSLGASFEMWEPQMPVLAGRFRVIRYDSRGHGHSEATPGPYSIEQMAGDALGLLDRLSVARADFCGLSMGGMVGMWIAINAPARLDRLVLANTAARIGTAEMWNARIDAVRKGGTASIASGVLARWFTPAMLEQPTPIVAQIRATFERISAAGYAASCAAVRDADQRHLLGRIHAPTLVIAGSDDQATPPDDGRFLADHIQGARYVELDAPHLSNIQAASAFTQALVQFLGNRGGTD